MNLERMVGGIPEGQIIKLYAGDYFDKFDSHWVPVHSPNPKYGSFNQIRLKLPKGGERLDIAYSKTGNCVMLIVKVKDEKEKFEGYSTLSRTLIKIEDPGGIEKARKVIEKFIAKNG